MKDINGKEITVGARLKDLDGRMHEVIRGDFEQSKYGEGPDLIADGGFRKVLINNDTVRTNEFVIVD